MRYVYYNVRSDLVPDEFRVSKELTELLTVMNTMNGKAIIILPYSLN